MTAFDIIVLVIIAVAAIGGFMRGLIQEVASLATWVIIAFFFRYSSLASIVTAVFAPAYFLLGGGVAWEAPGVMVLSLAAMAVLLVWRHAENINRLIAGTESKLGSKKK